MSIAEVRAALETRLGTLTPEISTAFENLDFEPEQDVPYQRAYLLPGTPDNSIQGTAVYFERGIFQVTLCYPVGGGVGLAQARAELLRNHFKRGTTLPQTPIQVIVMETPRIATGFVDGDRFCIPISIPYQSQIET